MKAKLEYCLRWLREGAVRVVRSYPVETLLALYACIRCLLTSELAWSEEELFNRLGLVPSTTWRGADRGGKSIGSCGRRSCR